MALDDILTEVSEGLSSLQTGAPVFTLDIAGHALSVVRFTGHEAISEQFEFRLEVAGGELDVEALIGEPALLRVQGAELPRQIHGLVCEAEYIGQTSQYQLYELVIAPWARQLAHRIGVRLFQDKTTRQIVHEVLTKAGLGEDWFRFSLVEDYAPRNYCVQYRETDLSFVSRLLEEDGIFYFYEHQDERHVWVMADSVAAHEPIAGTPAVWFNPTLGTMVQDQEHVRSFRFGTRMRSGRVVLRDENLHKPGQNMEALADAHSDTELEVYDFPGHYQDPGRGGPHMGESVARSRLEELRATRRVARGESDCNRLIPGAVLTLIGHPRMELDGEYRLLQVHHAGAQPQVLAQDAAGASSYTNSFECTEIKAPYSPPRRTPRPVMRGLQSAVVVGPEGEEVHVDQHGRVRIQFHWDREGRYDENSTCWVRVAQLWAGNGWGSMFIPRIGHEVLVDFLEGDPDRPVIVGRIYHGDNPPPYALPEQKTKSTIKSESSPGGGGFNEFRFEDRKGHEEVYLHAQKDWNAVVLHDHSEYVGVNRSVVVGAHNSTLAGASHSVTIKQPPPPPHDGEPPPPIKPTGSAMSDKFYSLTSGLATVTVDGADVTIEATGTVTIHSAGNLSINTDAGLFIGGKTINIGASESVSIGSIDVSVNGTTLQLGGSASAELTSKGPTSVSGVPVQLNGPGLFAGRVTELAPATITTGVALVVIGGASFPLPVVKLPDGTLQIGQNITVSPGTGRYDDFQNKTMRDLGVMASTPAGAERLNNLENNPGGHKLNIREYSAADELEHGPNNSITGSSGAGRKLTYDSDGNPVPGAGTDSFIGYNPDAVSGPAGHPKPGDARLFHETGHAEHNAYGVGRGGEAMGNDWHNAEEWQTIQGGVNRPGGTQVPGVPSSSSENTYLEQRNYPYRRSNHAGGWTYPDGSPIGP